MANKNSDHYKKAYNHGKRGGKFHGNLDHPDQIAGFRAGQRAYNQSSEGPKRSNPRQTAKKVSAAGRKRVAAKRTAVKRGSEGPKRSMPRKKK